MAKEKVQKRTKQYKVTGKLGAGTRFKKLKGALKKRGAKKPGALAAWIGRKKYGKKRMAKMAATGRKRAK